MKKRTTTEIEEAYKRAQAKKKWQEKQLSEGSPKDSTEIPYAPAKKWREKQLSEERPKDSTEIPYAPAKPPRAEYRPKMPDIPPVLPRKRYGSMKHLMDLQEMELRKREEMAKSRKRNLVQERMQSRKPKKRASSAFWEPEKTKNVTYLK